MGNANKTVGSYLLMMMIMMMIMMMMMMMMMMIQEVNLLPKDLHISLDNNR